MSTLFADCMLEFIDPASAMAAVMEHVDLVFPEYQDDELVVIRVVDTLYYFSFEEEEAIERLDGFARR